ncbi:MAG: choice-of-anchor Q domain-containing protein [Acidimicrobiales bacterium]
MSPRNRRRVLAVTGALSLVLALSPLGWSPASAQVTVTDDADLRAAVTAAAAGDTIVLGGDIALSCGSGALVVDVDLTLSGPVGAQPTLTIDGPCDRLVDVTGGASLTVQRLHLTGGRAPSGGTGVDGGSGGAIRSSGDVTVIDARLTDNAAGDGGNGSDAGDAGRAGGDGGAIAAAGDVTVVRSTFASNTAGDGGSGVTGAVGGAGTPGTAGDEIDEPGVPGGTGGTGEAGGSGGAGGRGGAVFASGAVSIDGSTLRNNAAGTGGSGGVGGAGGPGGDGGTGGPGLDSDGGDGGTGGPGGAGGAAGRGGAVSATTVSILASTLSSNTTGGAGPLGVGGIGGSGGSSGAGATDGDSGGIGAEGATGSVGQGGAVAATGAVTVTTATLVSNSASGAGAAGIFSGATLTLDHAIVAGTSPADTQCIASDVATPGGNVAGDDSCGAAGALLGVVADLGLGALGPHGGTTETFLPEAASAVVDAGSATCPATVDQRGTIRAQGTACDIGAVERRAPLLATVTGSAQPDTVGPGSSSQVTFAVTISGDSLGVLAEADLSPTITGCLTEPVRGGSPAPYGANDVVTFTCSVASDIVGSLAVGFEAEVPIDEGSIQSIQTDVLVNVTQAQTTTSTAPDGTTPTTGAPSDVGGGGQLPRTGLTILATVVVGGALLGGGTSLRSAARKGRTTSARTGATYGEPYPVDGRPGSDS